MKEYNVSYNDFYKSYEIKGDISYSDYTDLVNQIGTYYNVNTFQEEESKEQKAIRLAKEKAEKRNNKINQILGE